MEIIPQKYYFPFVDFFLLGARLVCQPWFSLSSPCFAVLLEGMLQGT